MSNSNKSLAMKEAVLAFIDRINQHDVEGIIGMLAEDYHFVNSAGDRFAGRPFMRETWQSQFALHPDFNIRVQRIIADDDGVAVFGWSEGTYAPDGVMRDENRWEVPAAFLGIAHEGKITHWQVFSDASIVFDLMKTRNAEAAAK
jgi:ketosteroid isomerase-like protein